MKIIKYTKDKDAKDEIENKVDKRRRSIKKSLKKKKLKK